MKQFRTKVLTNLTRNFFRVGFHSIVSVSLISAVPQAANAMNAEITSPMSGSVAITGNLRFCAGGNTQLTANLSGFTGTPSFTWRRNGVFMPGAATASITVDNPGMYTVTVNAGGETVTSAEVQVSVFRLKTLVQNACPGSTGNVNLVLLDNLGTVKSRNLAEQQVHYYVKDLQGGVFRFYLRPCRDTPFYRHY